MSFFYGGQSSIDLLSSVSSIGTSTSFVAETSNLTQLYADPNPKIQGLKVSWAVPVLSCPNKLFPIRSQYSPYMNQCGPLDFLELEGPKAQGYKPRGTPPKPLDNPKTFKPKTLEH